MITLQKQAFKHNPPETYGDCHRTCLAMMLGIDRDEVPNFAVHWDNLPQWKVAATEFLKARGLYEYGSAYKMETFGDLRKYMNEAHPCLPYMVTGTSRNGTNHVVVINEIGDMLDPAIDDSGIVGPATDGYFWVDVLVQWRR